MGSSNSNFLTITPGPYVGRTAKDIGEQLDATQKVHDDLMEKAIEQKAASEAIRDKATTPYGKALIDYFDKSVNDASDLLMRNGLNSISKQRVKDLLPIYSNTVLPVSVGLQAKDAFIKAQRAAQEGNNTSFGKSPLQFSVNGDDVSLDEFIKNPSMTYEVQDGGELSKRAATTFGYLQNNYRGSFGGRNWKNIFGQYYFTRKNVYGMTDSEIARGMMMDPNVPEWFKQGFNGLYQSAASSHWGNRYEDDRTIGFIFQGALAALAKPVFSDVRDEDGLNAAKAKRAAAAKVPPFRNYVIPYSMTKATGAMNDTVDEIKRITDGIDNGVEGLSWTANTFNDHDANVVKDIAKAKYSQSTYAAYGRENGGVSGSGPKVGVIDDGEIKQYKVCGSFKTNKYEYVAVPNNIGEYGDAGISGNFIFDSAKGSLLNRWKNTRLYYRPIGSHKPFEWAGYAGGNFAVTDSVPFASKQMWNEGYLDSLFSNRDSNGNIQINYDPKTGYYIDPSYIFFKDAKDPNISQTLRQGYVDKAYRMTAGAKDANGKPLWRAVKNKKGETMHVPASGTMTTITEYLNSMGNQLDQFNASTRYAYQLDVKPKLNMEVNTDIINKAISKNYHGLTFVDEDGKEALKNKYNDPVVVQDMLKHSSSVLNLIGPSGSMYMIHSYIDPNDSNAEPQRIIVKVDPDLYSGGSAQIDGCLKLIAQAWKERDDLSNKYVNEIKKRVENGGSKSNSKNVNLDSGQFDSLDEEYRTKIEGLSAVIRDNSNAIYKMIIARFRHMAQATGDTSSKDFTFADDYGSDSDDDDGSEGSEGDDGSDGTNGTDGTDGSDGGNQ